MNFEDTGLPKIKLIEDAFAYSKKDVMSSAKEDTKSVEDQIKQFFGQHLKSLEAAFKAEKVSEDQYKMNKAAIEKQLQQELTKAPAYVARELNALFSSRRVFAAKEAATGTSVSSPELVAAALLLEAMRSPIDYKTISAEISPVVADIVAHVMHLESYPSERAAHIQTVSDDTKRAYLIGLTSSMNHLTSQAKQMKGAGGAIQLQAGQEQQIFEDVKAIWGTDAKLEARFIKIFNDTMSLVGSPFTLSADDKGALQLVKGGRNIAPKRPGGPRPPSGNGGIGDSVF